MTTDAGNEILEPVEEQQSVLRFSFPPAGGLTDQSQIRVRGRSEGCTSEVSVNGARAVSDNGYADWQATIPLTEEGNINVTAENDPTNSFCASTTRTISVRRSTHWLGRPRGMFFDGAQNRLLIADQTPPQIISVGLGGEGLEGAFSVISGTDRGIGPSLEEPTAVTPFGSQLLVTDSDRGAVISIDATTGNRTIFADRSCGGGGLLDEPQGVVVDGTRVLVSDNDALVAILDGTCSLFLDLRQAPACKAPTTMVMHPDGRRLLVICADPEALMEIDLDSGQHRFVATASQPEGVFPNQLEGLSADPKRPERALLSGAGNVLAIDLASGIRTVISDERIGSGEVLADPVQIVSDSTGDRAIVADLDYNALVEVDLAGGDRVLFTGAGVGTGVTFVAPVAMAFDAVNERIIVLDDGDSRQALIAVDLVSGDRSQLASLCGVGEECDLKDVVLDAKGRVLVSDEDRGLILSVDVGIGSYEVIAGLSNGPGVTLKSPQGLVIDGDRALIVDDEQDALLSLDLNTGELMIISNNTVGSGESFKDPHRLALDREQDRVLVIDSTLAALFEVDLQTGNRNIVSNDSIGEGPAFEKPVGLRYDSAAQRAWIVDREASVLFKVDTISGDRVVEASAVNGYGPRFSDPRDFMLTPDGRSGWLLSEDLDAVLMVDLGCIESPVLACGERVVISR